MIAGRYKDLSQTMNNSLLLMKVFSEVFVLSYLLTRRASTVGHGSPVRLSLYSCHKKFSDPVQLKKAWTESENFCGGSVSMHVL